MQFKIVSMRSGRPIMRPPPPPPVSQKFSPNVAIDETVPMIVRLIDDVAFSRSRPLNERCR